MKEITLTFLSILYFIPAIGQTNSDGTNLVEIPNSKFAVYKYAPELKTDILVYQYFDIIDLDNDGLKDQLSFISNGGAHAHYYPQITLSSNSQTTTFKELLIDMPYLVENQKIDSMTQFLIIYYDKDGIDEIYLNLDNSFVIHENLKNYGLNSNFVIVEFNNDKLIVKDFKK